MKTTTVANALFLSSCAPLLAAILGYLALGEKLSLWQTASIALGLAGLLIIVGGGLGAGSLIGNVCAIATAFGFASASVAMRRGRARDYSPAIFGYGLIACIFSALVCLGEGVSLVSPLADVVAALAGGLLPMGLGFACFLRGAPRVPAAAQTVLAQTETIFGPVWVWLAFGEEPAAADSDRRLGHPRRCGLDGRRQFISATSAHPRHYGKLTFSMFRRAVRHWPPAGAHDSLELLSRQ